MATQEAIKKLIAKYIETRDLKRTTQDKHKEELAPINNRLIKIENAMQRELQKSGVDSMKTSEGTAYLAHTTKARVEDWQALKEFLLENDLLDMVEKRVSKEAVEEFFESTGEYPPGVAISREVNTRFRK